MARIMAQHLLQRILQLTVTLLAALILCMPSMAEPIVEVVVATSYIDVHTGPGRGYPIFHVLEEGEELVIEKRRTDWFKISTDKDISGWVHRSQISLTEGTFGDRVALSQADIDNYSNRRWEMGFTLGDFQGADSIGAHLGYRMSNNLTLEGRLKQATGSFSNSRLATIGIMHQTFPEWRLSPFFTIGAGSISVEPNTTLIRTEDRRDNLLLVGTGAYYYISRRFMARFEYNNYTILTSRERNEDIDEWKLGFSVFF